MSVAKAVLRCLYTSSTIVQSMHRAQERRCHNCATLLVQEELCGRCGADPEARSFTMDQAAFLALALAAMYLVWLGAIIIAAPGSVVAQFLVVFEGSGLSDAQVELYVLAMSAAMVAFGLLGFYGAALALRKQRWRRAMAVAVAVTATAPLFLFSALAAVAAWALWRARPAFHS